MTLEIALVFAIVALTIAAFASERYPVDFVAFTLLAAFLGLASFGLIRLSPQEILSGFSNTATITVLAMFVLSAGVYRTGAVHLLARRIARHAAGGELRQLLAITAVTAPVSAFINNTAAVAILIPMVSALARQNRTPPSRLLIPLSYVSQLAGVASLVGTSTSILGSQVAEQLGLRGFGMFEFTPVGLAALIAGTLYLVFIGRHLLPNRGAGERGPQGHGPGTTRPYAAELLLEPQSPLAGRTISESNLGRDHDITILRVVRDGEKLGLPTGATVLQAGDILFVHATSEQLLDLREHQGLAMEPEARLGTLEWGDEAELLEVVIAPGSDLAGGTLVEHGFRNRYGCTVLALRRHAEVLDERLHRIRLRVGDTLLVQADRLTLDRFRSDPDFIVADGGHPETFRVRRLPVAVAIVAGVVLIAAFGIQPILVAAVEGCVLMVLTGCLRVSELHESIRWDVIFLLAGVVPLGLALERSGGAAMLADGAIRVSAFLSPVGVLALFYVLSMLLTALISNNATVLLLAPIGVATARALELDPRAFVLAIMLSASLDFSTPVGYQTNTMVYSLGGYRFMDFVRVGAPLNILLAVVVPVAIAWFWSV